MRAWITTLPQQRIELTFRAREVYEAAPRIVPASPHPPKRENILEALAAVNAPPRRSYN